MRFRVISLNKTPHRLASFKRDNPEFLFEKFTAIDGSKVDRNELLNNNLATAPVLKRYTDGAIGVAMSHRALWQECADSKENMTILEDDAYLVPNFNSLVVRTTNNTNWDFIFWGANLDQKIIAELSPGIAAAEINFNQPGVIANKHKLKQQNWLPTLFRVHWAVGLMCYSVTPQSAKYLLDVIFPLRDYFDFRDNFGIDNSIIEELSNMRSYICFPPIALTENDRYNSTVQINN